MQCWCIWSDKLGQSWIIRDDKGQARWVCTKAHSSLKLLRSEAITSAYVVNCVNKIMFSFEWKCQIRETSLEPLMKVLNDDLSQEKL